MKKYLYMLPSTILVAAVFASQLSLRYALIGFGLWVPVLFSAHWENTRARRAPATSAKASEPSG